MKKNKLRLALLSLLSALAIAPLAQAAQPADSTARHRLTHVVSAEFRPAYVFPTGAFLRGDNAAGKPIDTHLSGHLKYGFRFAPDTYWGRLYPHAVQGIGVAYNTFLNASEMGNPVSVYVFQTAPVFTLSPRLSLDYEWNFGASFGWKKYDPDSNSMNMLVGSKINAYINLGFFLNWAIDSQTRLKAGIDVTHYSNGNTGYPNAGINSIGAAVGLTRYFGATSGAERSDASSALHTAMPQDFRSRMSYDLVLYGATRKKAVYPADADPVLVPGSFGIAGLNFTPMYSFSRYFRAGVSLDAQYDESANIGDHIVDGLVYPDADNIRFHRPPFREQFSVGLSVRAEVVMPIFSINLGIGRNILCKGPDTDAFYQILALKTHLTRRLFLHVGYQLSRFKDPNNLMLGLGWRFGKIIR